VAGRNALSYQACQDGAHLVGVVASPGWTYTVIASGPPTVSVTFTNGSTSVTCTLRSGGDGSIDTSDC
jgi:hypothetical protein